MSDAPVIGDDKPYTVSEVMCLLGCSDDALFEHVHSGNIAAAKIGRKYVFPRGPFLESLSRLGREQAQERAARAARAKGRRADLNARQHAARLQRQPAWADEKAIREYYRQARQATERTGIPHHVDHVIPLQGRLVSGLHVENNLRVLRADLNISKSNHFEVDV